MAVPLPPPGPDHYAARRARWLAAPAPCERRAPHSHARLQRLLSHPDPHTDTVWNRGIDQVWNGLTNGNRLKHRLPMSLVIKIIHAAWRRDPSTWPEGAAAPDSDDSHPTTSAPTPSLPAHVPDNPSAEPPH